MTYAKSAPLQEFTNMDERMTNKLLSVQQQAVNLGKDKWMKKIFLVIATRWVSVAEFHDWALGIGKVFDQESTVVKWNYQILGLH